MKSWTVVVNRTDENDGSSVPPGHPRRIVVSASGDLHRISVDGRYRSHHEKDGVLYFSIGLFGCTIARDKYGEWVLKVGGRVIDSGDSLTPPTMDARSSSVGGLPRIAVSRRLLVGVAVLLLSMIGWQLRGRFSAHQSPWTPAWHDHRSEDGRFSVQLPAEAHDGVETVGDAGATLQVHTVSSSMGEAGAFSVAWSDLPADVVENQTALDQACETTLQSMLNRARNEQGTNYGKVTVDARGVAFDGASGTQATCTLSGRIDRPWRISDLWSQKKNGVYVVGVTFSARGVVMNGRLYVSVAILAPEHAQNPDVERFFQSLQIDSPA